MISKYKNAHLWLLIPFVIVLLGFAPSYWAKFSVAPWRHHLHGLTATLWFLLLALQPYFVTRGQVERHRLYGMFGLVLAGGVALTAYGMIPYNLANEQMSDGAKYGLSFIDFVLIPGFVVAVGMAIKNRKSLDDHAKWMISTVFWAVSPGLFRLSFVPVVLLGGTDFAQLAPILLALTGVANIAVLGILMFRDRRAHPAYVFAAIGSLVMLTPMTVANMQWWRNFADALFTI